MSPDEPLYEITALRRVYPAGEVRALDGVDLCLWRGELVAIEGTSGSGKSTLLSILGGLDRPSEGSVRFDGTEMGELSDAELTSLRSRDIGFVFQSFNLIPTLTAQQNVMAVMGSLRLSPAEQRSRAVELLERVGLADRAHHLPSRMSGGEQQRVAIARALANHPRVVLADEPTGNLDSATAESVMALLRELGDGLGVTVVLVTHDVGVAAQAPRRVRMKDGLVVSDNGAHRAVVRPRVVSADPVAAGSADVAEVDAGRRREPGLDGGRVVDLTAARVARTRPRVRGTALVGQAAALVALAGLGAVTLMPHNNPASAPCTSCVEAAAPAPTAAPRVLQPPSRPAPKPSVAAAPVRPQPTRAVVRTSYRKPVAQPTASPVALPVLPVRVPVVKVPKPVPPVTVPTEVPVPEVPVPAPSPTAATWNPLWPFSSTSMMDLIWASMATGSNRTR